MRNGNVEIGISLMTKCHSSMLMCYASHIIEGYQETARHFAYADLYAILNVKVNCMKYPNTANNKPCHYHRE